MNIFVDLDGTIVDSSERHFQVYRKIVEEFQGRPLPKHEYWEMIRRQAEKTEILRESGLAHVDPGRYLDRFLSAIECVENLKFERIISGGILAALENLMKGHRLFLVTLRKNEENARDEIKGLGLELYFEKIIICRGDKAEAIAPHLDKDAAQNVIVGDTEVDIRAAKKLGVKSIGVLSGFRNEELMRGLNPDLICDDLGQLQGVIKI